MQLVRPFEIIRHTKVQVGSKLPKHGVPVVVVQLYRDNHNFINKCRHKIISRYHEIILVLNEITSVVLNNVTTTLALNEITLVGETTTTVAAAVVVVIITHNQEDSLIITEEEGKLNIACILSNFLLQLNEFILDVEISTIIDDKIEAAAAAAVVKEAMEIIMVLEMIPQQRHALISIEIHHPSPQARSDQIVRLKLILRRNR